MSSNAFGNIFCFTSYGESHGKSIGGIIEGCPPGFKFDFKAIQYDLNNRRPGQSKITSSRDEKDVVEFLSGFNNNISLGTPIAFQIKNENKISNDYSNIKNIFRPSHADYSYNIKYGIRDYRGGGRSSARETASRVVAGSIAKQVLNKFGIKFITYVSSIGLIKLKKSYKEININEINHSLVKCPDNIISKKMIKLIESVKNEGDTIGGIVTAVIKNTPAGLGEPIFDKLQANLAKAMLSINGAKGFDYGGGFEMTKLKGSDVNDEFVKKNNKLTTKTNFSGGIQGGISNGNDIYFRVGFKPVSSIFKIQNSYDNEGKKVKFKIEGRHDPCIVPRAVPIVESMCAITILDHFLRNKCIKI